MGWRGTFRSIGAAVRAAERDARRRQREIEKQVLQQAKFNEQYRAALEVEAYDNLVERLRSVHKDCSAPVDWAKQAASPEPPKPERIGRKEVAARYAANTYEPTWFDRLFGLETKKRLRLAEAITTARALDEEEYTQAVNLWTASHKEWEDETEFARRVLAGDESAYVEVIKEVNPFSEISDLGTGIVFNTVGRDLIVAELAIHGDDSIPKEAKTLLKSGKLSTKPLPAGKFYELQQDYVCSCVLRIANELFAILPISMVIVTASDLLLNTSTGYQEERPILSVAIPRTTLLRINLHAIDPSDAMRQFLYRMDFKKTKGFAAVEAIDPVEIGPDS